MYKPWLIATVYVLLMVPLMAEQVPISIVEQKDYEILEQFFKLEILEEGYGYVLEGLKPISVRNFMPIEEILPYKNCDFAINQFANTLLVGKAIDVWKKICSVQKNFVLKAIPLRSSTTGWELQFINIKKLRGVIENNIALFRYILGPAVQTEKLANQIAYSDQDLCSILQNDLVLVGIVLGYGTHNSLVGGRSETISEMVISKDVAPFLPSGQLMLSKKKHSINFFTPQAFGTYYLAFAGGDDSHFRDEVKTIRPSQDFQTIEDEIVAINEMNDNFYPAELMQQPRFVFNAYKGGASNEPLFKRLVHTQKQIQAILKQSDFLEIVLEKIGGEKPIISCKKTKQTGAKIQGDFSVLEWIRILKETATQFDDKEMQLAFFESYCQPNKADQVPPKIVGASKEMLTGLKIALSNLSKANCHFKTIPKDSSFKPIIPNRLYFKTIQEGKGESLIGDGRVRIGYVIEDLKGNILFANSDIWLNLSQIVSGFAHGLQGMKIGEIRIIHIHPAYGYGALTTLPPCSGLIIKAHLIDLDKMISAQQLPLVPLDMEWLQNYSFAADIESSLRQKPHYLGYLYRRMLDQIDGLDQSDIMAGLSSVRKRLKNGKH